jgi:uncharacterized SAM-binding protein YcdF (DUF218 family)
MHNFFAVLFTQYSLLMLCLGLALANLWWRGRETRGRLLLVTSPFLVLMLLSAEPIEYLLLGTLEWENKPLATRPDDAQAIVVLAGAVRPANGWRLRDELDESTTYRCLCASALYREGGPCLILVSGGKSDVEKPGPPCALAMRDFLMDLVVRESDVIVEDKSSSTYENALESSKMLAARGIHRIILVTDAVHMVRAAGCFRRRGFEVVPAACHHVATGYTFELEDLIPRPVSVSNCQRVWHEWLGLAWYKLRDRT